MGISKKVEDLNGRNLPPKVAVEAKYDGIWFTAIRKGNEVQIFSRSGQRKTRLENEYGKFLMNLRPGQMLFGEAEFGTQWASDMKERRGYNVLWLFDIIDGWDDTRTYLQRKQRLQEFWKLCGSPKEVVVAPFQVISSGEVDEAFKKITELGFEGIVVKFPIDLNIGCEVWLRRKVTVTEDYVVIGVEYGNSSWDLAKQWGYCGKVIKALVGGLYVDGELKKICSVGSLDLKLRIEISKNPESFIGRVFEAKGFKKFKSGALRHPSFVRWREDKTPEMCKL